MKFKGISSVAILGLLTMVGFVLVSAGAVHHLFQTPLPQAAAAGGGPSGTQKANLEAYATLLHENVVDQKEQVVALVLSLNEADAAKFWPIYSLTWTVAPNTRCRLQVSAQGCRRTRSHHPRSGRS